MKHITLQEYKQLQQKGNSKYKNKKTTIDGIKFDSKKEGNRYLELKLLLKAGKIRDLELQKKFTLQERYKINGKTIRAISYISDFTYWDNEKNEMIVEDVKGGKATQTQIYKLKKKIFMYRYGIEIKEV